MAESCLFGLLAWPSASDASAGTLRVPPVDGLRHPAARATDYGIRLRQCIRCGVLHAQTFADLLEAEICDGHSARQPAGNSAMANPGVVMSMSANAPVADTAANGTAVMASFLGWLMKLMEPLTVNKAITALRCIPLVFP